MACHVECEKTKFYMSISVHSFPSPGQKYEEYALNPIVKEYFSDMNLTFDLLNSSLSCIYIHFDDIEYTQIESQQARTVFDLVSNVGG